MSHWALLPSNTQPVILVREFDDVQAMNPPWVPSWLSLLTLLMMWMLLRQLVMAVLSLALLTNACVEKSDNLD